MNSLMFNITRYRIKTSPAIRLKIVVQTDGINFGMYSQRTFKWYMTRLSKLKISWRRGKEYTSLVTLGGRHRYKKVCHSTTNWFNLLRGTLKNKSVESNKILLSRVSDFVFEGARDFAVTYLFFPCNKITAFIRTVEEELYTVICLKLRWL